MAHVRAMAVVLLIATPVLCIAQSPFEVCNPALGQLKENYASFSERELFTTYQSLLRRIDSSSYQSFVTSAKSINLNVPLAEEMLGLKGSDAQKQQEFSAKYAEFVNSSFEQSLAHDVFQLKKDTVSKVMADAWTRCYEIVSATLLQQNGTFIAAAPIGADLQDFLVTVRTRSPQAGDKVKIKAIEPAKQVTCFRDNQLVTVGLELPSTEFDLRCTKESSLSVPVSIETNTGISQKLTLPSYDQKVQALRDEVSNLRASITALQTLVAQNNQSVASSITALTNSLRSGIEASNAANYGAQGERDQTNDFRYRVGNAGDVKCGKPRTFLTGIHYFGDGTYYIICQAAGPAIAP